MNGDTTAMVQEVMDSYLDGAVDVVCNGGALGHLLGDLDDIPDALLGVVAGLLVAGYLQGCASLHAAMIQGAPPALPNPV